jgi:hypothetical protein
MKYSRIGEFSPGFHCSTMRDRFTHFSTRAVKALDMEPPKGWKFSLCALNHTQCANRRVGEDIMTLVLDLPRELYEKLDALSKELDMTPPSLVEEYANIVAIEAFADPGFKLLKVGACGSNGSDTVPVVVLVKLDETPVTPQVLDRFEALAKKQKMPVTDLIERQIVAHLREELRGKVDIYGLNFEKTLLRYRLAQRARVTRDCIVRSIGETSAVG